MDSYSNVQSLLLIFLFQIGYQDFVNKRVLNDILQSGSNYGPTLCNSGPVHTKFRGVKNYSVNVFATFDQRHFTKNIFSHLVFCWLFEI